MRLPRTRNMVLLLWLVLVLGLFFPACGGGDGGDSEVGYSFDSANMMEAAGTGSGLTTFFPEFTDFSAAMLSLIALEGTPRLPQSYAAIPVSVTGLCASGSASLTWNDADNDLSLSTGDTASLTFSNCVVIDAPVSGTIAYDFVAVPSFDNVTADVTVDVTVADVDIERISGDFRFNGSSSDGGATYAFLYGGTTRSDLLTASVNGTQLFQFGCFDVEHHFSAATPDNNYTVRARGVANVGGKIMTLGSYFGPDTPFLFLDIGGQPTPVSGMLTLISYDARPSAGLSACGRVGSSGNVSTNQNTLLITATGGGDIRVDLRNDSGATLDTQYTTWQALTLD